MKTWKLKAYTGNDGVILIDIVDSETGEWVRNLMMIFPNGAVVRHGEANPIADGYTNQDAKFNDSGQIVLEVT